MIQRSMLDGTFKLGLFAANLPGGLATTTIKEKWSGKWDDCVALARFADQVGIDFMLPIARYIGFGGPDNFHGESLDSSTWAAGLLSHTEQITVFSTVHTAFVHPLVAAKQIATIDQIGHGRAGLNIVAGWNKPEYDMFGLDLPESHDARYALGREWWEIVQKVWTSDASFDHDGQFFRLQHVEGEPKPFNGLPPIFNAGSSHQGRSFAARTSDFILTTVQNIEDGARVRAALDEQARLEYGRTVGVVTHGQVVCRPTRQEARDYLHYYAEENMNGEAVDKIMTLFGLYNKSFSPELLPKMRARIAAGQGSIPIVGNPDEVAMEIARFHQAGFAGIALSFVHFARELDYFADEVLPRLERLGVRSRVKSDLAQPAQHRGR